MYAAIAKTTEPKVAEAPVVEMIQEVEVLELIPEVKEFTFDDATLFQICRCESDIFGYGKPTQYEQDGVTVIKGRIDSDDTGACQINKRYHLKDSIALGYDIETLEGNWGYAKHLLKTQGTKPWNASRSCWANRL